MIGGPGALAPARVHLRIGHREHLLDQRLARLVGPVRVGEIDHHERARQVDALDYRTHDPQDALSLGGDTAFVTKGIVRPPVETAALLANPPPDVQDYLGRK